MCVRACVSAHVCTDHFLSPQLEPHSFHLSLSCELLDPVIPGGLQGLSLHRSGLSSPRAFTQHKPRAVGPLSSRHPYPVSTSASTTHLRHAPPCHLPSDCCRPSLQTSCPVLSSLHDHYVLLLCLSSSNMKWSPCSSPAVSSLIHRRDWKGTLEPHRSLKPHTQVNVGN